eukprot:gb/GECG01007237.1/.p1 GENE.gb/GECG01007237.1/~~gb/GECG01007237.1/.p1  ORF type:complete len:405 (+),score=50.29 gb/GECG01007237.1/:1-1215(+)
MKLRRTSHFRNTRSTWSAKVGSTPNEREIAANAATGALIALYESRGDKFDRRSMEVVKIRMKDRDSISTTSSSRYLDPKKASTEKIQKKGRRLSRALAFSTDEPPSPKTPVLDIPQLEVNTNEETAIKPSLDIAPTEMPALTSLGSEYSLQSSTSCISTQEDHPLWSQASEDAFDEILSRGSFSSIDDIEVAKSMGDQDFVEAYKSIPKSDKPRRESIKEIEKKRRTLDLFTTDAIKPKADHFVLGKLGGAPLTARSEPSPRVEDHTGSVEIPVFPKRSKRRASIHQDTGIKTRSKVVEKKRSKGVDAPLQRQAATPQKSTDFKTDVQIANSPATPLDEFLQNDITDFETPREDGLPKTQFSLANVLHPSQTPRTKSRTRGKSPDRRVFSPSLKRAGHAILSPH